MVPSRFSSLKQSDVKNKPADKPAARLIHVSVANNPLPRLGHPGPTADLPTPPVPIRRLPRATDCPWLGKSPSGRWWRGCRS